MKLFKLQMLTTKFESIKMKEDETFTTLYLKLSDVVISSFSLGEKILDYNIVRKFLRSLPMRFLNLRLLLQTSTL